MDYSNNYQQPNQEREFGWDDTIQNESQFIDIQDGIYDFVVEKFERGRFAGSEKMPACNKATLTLGIDTIEGHGTIKVDLLLHSKVEWKLSEFFICIGQKKKGEPLRMNWNAVYGARGRVEVDHREHNGNRYPQVKKFLEPPVQQYQQSQAQYGQPQQQKAWTKGQL